MPGRTTGGHTQAKARAEHSGAQRAALHGEDVARQGGREGRDGADWRGGEEESERCT